MTPASLRDRHSGTGSWFTAGSHPGSFGHELAARTGTLDPSSPRGYRGRPQLGLFDNPGHVLSLDELAETVRTLKQKRPGRTVEALSVAVFTELARPGHHRIQPAASRPSLLN